METLVLDWDADLPKLKRKGRRTISPPENGVLKGSVLPRIQKLIETNMSPRCHVEIPVVPGCAIEMKIRWGTAIYRFGL